MIIAQRPGRHQVQCRQDGPGQTVGQAHRRMSGAD